MDEFDNALAWFKAAPGKLYDASAGNLEASAQWLWEVLQGDFNEDQTTAQTVTSTVISMIPLVDQICDIRDVVANCKKINQDKSNKWAWLALALTLIGLFPTLGSLVKGCFKILFAYGRKGIFSVGKKALDSNLWNATQPFVEAGIGKLNDFLARAPVRKTLSAMKLDNPYQELAKQLRKVSGQLSVSKLTTAFDSAVGALGSLLGRVKKWGPTSVREPAARLIDLVADVRKQANDGLAEVLAPLQNWLNRLAQRLDVEHRINYRASTNAVNPHNFARMSLDAEIEALHKALPDYVKAAKKGEFKELRNPPSVPPGHFSIGHAADEGLANAFKTFHTVRADVLPPGTKIYRVLAPGSRDNSICWMAEAEFKKLKSKADWRDRFAVWRNWNVNGEYLTYTVPPGRGLPVWRGTTGSQKLKRRDGSSVEADDKGNGFWLQGGAEQMVVNPKDLLPSHASKRAYTGWGYDEGDIEVSLVGVPILQTNWNIPK